MATATGFTVIFTDCREPFDDNGDGVDDVEVSTDGSVSFSVSNIGFRTQRTPISDGRLAEEMCLDLTAAGTIKNSRRYQEVEFPAASTAVINGTFSGKVADADICG
jgi:hypothetical protein